MNKESGLTKVDTLQQWNSMKMLSESKKRGIISFQFAMWDIYTLSRLINIYFTLGTATWIGSSISSFIYLSYHTYHPWLYIHYYSSGSPYKDKMIASLNIPVELTEHKVISFFNILVKLTDHKDINLGFSWQKYSGSKNCSSVCLFWKDCIGTECWHDPGSWFFGHRKYNILASRNILDHVIWIKTHRVLSQNKHQLIWTVFWLSIIFSILVLAKL